MAYEVIDTSNFGRFLGKIKTLLTGFWSKEDTTELTIDSTPTANSNNLVKSGGVKSYVDGAIPSVPVQDVTVGGSSVVSSGTAVIPAIPDEVVANPTVPSGTTPTALSNLKVGNDYYSVPQTSGLESASNKVTSLSSQSTDTQYPSAKCVYDGLDLRPKAYLCTDEAEYEAIANPDSKTLYLIPKI